MMLLFFSWLLLVSLVLGAFAVAAREVPV